MKTYAQALSNNHGARFAACCARLGLSGYAFVPGSRRSQIDMSVFSKLGCPERSQECIRIVRMNGARSLCFAGLCFMKLPGSKSPKPFSLESFSQFRDPCPTHSPTMHNQLCVHLGPFITENLSLFSLSFSIAVFCLHACYNGRAKPCMTLYTT